MCIYVVINCEIGEVCGFVFVNMVSKEDGERVIVKFDGYGYDNFIFCVEWVVLCEECLR